MVRCDGMATMTHRSTFAFDQATIRRLKNLSLLWHVSQAEVIRRALSQTEKTATTLKIDPIKKLALLHASGEGVSEKEGNAYLEEVYEGRTQWRGE